MSNSLRIDPAHRRARTLARRACQLAGRLGLDEVTVEPRGDLAPSLRR